ncbi:MAG TPA: TetR/AcrR family transcriptional regulator [Thermosynechococcaceae cyanobacterium]
MSNSEQQRPGRPRSVQSHQAMLQATLELLAEVGFDALSIEAIAARAKVGKTTIYRRYSSKAELVADAIESLREELLIPDTGAFRSDLEVLVQEAARLTFTPLGRQAVSMIISSAASNAQFAQIYWLKYLQPRRESFAVVVERAKQRQEVSAGVDSDLVFDAMSAIMLYALIFPPTSEDWTVYVRRALSLLFESPAQ